MVIGIVNTINKIFLIAIASIIRQIMMMVAPCGNAKFCFRIGLFQAELGQLDLQKIMMITIGIIFNIILKIRLFIIIIIIIITTIIIIMTDGSIS